MSSASDSPLDSYFVQFALAMIGSVSLFAGIAGGYYTIYRVLTLIGN